LGDKGKQDFVSFYLTPVGLTKSIPLAPFPSAGSLRGDSVEPGQALYKRKGEEK